MGKKTKDDPTGMAANRNKTTRRLKIRLERARREVIGLFRAVPRTRSTETVIVNEQQVVYTYDLTPVQLESLQAEVRAAINAELLETQGEVMPPNWWFQNEVELPTRQGTLEEIVRFNQLISAAIIAGVTVRGMEPQRVAPEIVLTSRQYLDNLRNVYVENFATIKTLSNRTADQVIQQLTSGMRSGLTPTEIAKNITERFDVSKSSAQRIARTEVNKAYVNGKMNAVKMVAEQTGLRAGVIHVSALTSTTRTGHAARHGNAYTVSSQEQWWDSGANRINCLCSVQSVLIDSKGKVVQKEEQQEIKQEGKEFFN